MKREVWQRYTQILEREGRFGSPYKMRLKPEYTPVIEPVRFVPYARKRQLKKELDRMEPLGVISKIVSLQSLLIL